MIDTETFESEIRSRILASKTSSDRLIIAEELLQISVEQTNKISSNYKEVCEKYRENLARMIRLFDVIFELHKTTVASIHDDEDVLRFPMNTDPRKLMTLLVRAVEECRMMIAVTQGGKTLQ